MMDEEEELLAELFRANDRLATIIRSESTETRIDGTFDLRKIADGFSAAVLRSRLVTADGRARLQARIRAARAAGRAVDEPSSTAAGMRRQPTMDDGELLAEALRANGQLATITRAEGSEVTRVDGTFILGQIASVFEAVIKDRDLREIFLEAPRDPEEVLEELRNYVERHR